MSEPRYLIDTSVFIQADKAYYSFGVCPGFWEGLIALHRQGRVLSIDRVYDEICFGDEDELTNWAKISMPSNFFAKSNAPEVVKWYGAIQTWANAEPQFFPAVKAAFADETDAWIVAYAGAYNLTVVTGEVYSATVKNKIPIPNICRAKNFQVNCIDIFAMLARLRIQFVLKQ